MRVAVFGAGGFIGSHLMRTLHAQGFGAESLAHTSQVALEKPAGYRERLKLVDAVVLLASGTTPSESSITAEISKNIYPYSVFAATAAEIGVKKIVYISSGGTVYGQCQFSPITEDHPLVPIGSYGIGKLLTENLLTHYLASTEVEVIILRPSNPIGAGQGRRGVGFVSRAISAALYHSPLEIWGDGSIVRDYFDVRDLCEAIVLALKSSLPSGSILNVGSGRGSSQREIVDLVRLQVGLDIEISYKAARMIDVSYNVLSPEKIKKVLDWRPSFSLVQSVQHIAETMSYR